MSKFRPFDPFDRVKFLGWDNYKEDSFNPLIIGQIYSVQSNDKKRPGYIKLHGVNGSFFYDVFERVI